MTIEPRAMRDALIARQTAPGAFRAALVALPERERDGWVDEVFGLDGLPSDDPGLPRGCVPYLPSSATTLLRMVELAGLGPDDVFVDVGAGVGRAALLTHLLTGASAISIEIQPGLVRAARELAARLNVGRVSVMEGDAAALTATLTAGSVFFLYCPFSGERLDGVLDALESIARSRTIRVCSLDLPLPSRPFLEAVSLSLDLAVYRST